MAVASAASLRDRAELLADVYGRVSQRNVRPGKWLIPLRDQDGSFIGKVSEEVRVALVQRGEATDLPRAESEYSEAYRTVTLAVQDAALNAAFFEVFPKQVKMLRDLGNRLGRTGIPERLHRIAEAVDRRVSGFSPSGPDEAYAEKKSEPYSRAQERLPQADPHYPAYVQDSLRGRVKAALAAEYTANLREKPVAARRSRPTQTGRPTPDPGKQTRDAWDLCKVLSLHPKFLQILAAYSSGAEQGTALARALVDEAVAATRQFSEILRSNPEHAWRYPPLIMLGVKRLGLGHVEGFPEYNADLAAVVSASVAKEVLTVLGLVLFVVGILLMGPLAPLGAEAALTVVFADLAVGGAQTSLTYIEERERNLAAVGGRFESSGKIAEQGGYTGTWLDGTATLICGIAFVFGGLKLLRSWRKPPGRPPPARPRPPFDPVGGSKELNRGIERARFPDPPWRRPPRRPQSRTPGAADAEGQRIAMASGMRNPPPSPAPAPGETPAPDPSVRARPAPAAGPNANLTNQTALGGAEAAKGSARATAESQKALPRKPLPRALRDRLTDLGEWTRVGKVNINDGGITLKQNLRKPARQLTPEQFEEGIRQQVMHWFAKRVSNKPVVRHSHPSEIGWETLSSTKTNQLKIEKNVVGNLGEGARLIRRPDGIMEVVENVGTGERYVDEVQYFEATLQSDFEAEIGFLGHKQRQTSGTAWIADKLPRKRYSPATRQYYNIFCPDSPSPRTLDFLNGLMENSPNLEINWFIVQ